MSEYFKIKAERCKPDKAFENVCQIIYKNIRPILDKQLQHAYIDGRADYARIDVIAIQKVADILKSYFEKPEEYDGLPSSDFLHDLGLRIEAGLRNDEIKNPICSTCWEYKPDCLCKYKEQGETK